MRFNEHQSLQSEVIALEQMLSEIPEEDVLDRRGIQARLASVRALLPTDLANVEKKERASAALTFRGKPVVGTHGIFADFGAKATANFSEAVAAIAASLTAPLKSMGPIPDRESNQLLITGVAVGSFGFELEEAGPAPLLSDQSTKVSKALTRAVSLLSAMVNDDDEVLADNVEDLDQRALAKMRDFVRILSENDATCALTYEKSRFSFPTTDAVKRGLERISDTNILESEETVEGILLGILPNRRSFEFRIKDTDELISGKISTVIGEPSELNRYVGKLVKASIVTTKINAGKKRHVLRQVLGPDDRNDLLAVAPF